MSDVKKTFLLADAASHVEDFMKTLDVSFTDCECCTAKRYTNFREYLAHNELGAVLTKLRRFESMFRVTSTDRR